MFVIYSQSVLVFLKFVVFNNQNSKYDSQFHHSLAEKDQGSLLLLDSTIKNHFPNQTSDKFNYNTVREDFLKNVEKPNQITFSDCLVNWERAQRDSQYIYQSFLHTYPTINRLFEDFISSLSKVRLHNSHIVLNYLDFIFQIWIHLFTECDYIKNRDGIIESLPSSLKEKVININKKLKFKNSSENCEVPEISKSKGKNSYILSLSDLFNQSFLLYEYIFSEKFYLPKCFLIFACGLMSCFPISKSTSVSINKLDCEVLSPLNQFLSAIKYLSSWRPTLLSYCPLNLSLFKCAPELFFLQPLIMTSDIDIPSSSLFFSSSSDFETKEKIQFIFPEVAFRQRCSPFAFYVMLDDFLTPYPISICENSENCSSAFKCSIPLTSPLFCPLLSFISKTSVKHTFALYSSVSSLIFPPKFEEYFGNRLTISQSPFFLPSLSSLISDHLNHSLRHHPKSLELKLFKNLNYYNLDGVNGFFFFFFSKNK
jgi:hypothetical protein